ncbi:hypothetical protein QQX98_006495 [Neonectria punicea]|uniref:ZZ-type domain-containing protein n=1 Tax=Neonectria punicea TaxID=979145 RepID=A0ABR1H0K4_9HYPO
MINAARPTLAEDYDDVSEWESAKELHRRITTLSIAIVFLGCPHRAESIEILEDEVHRLMSLPGPVIRNGIMGKIRNIAHQVNNVNLQFLDVKINADLISVYGFYPKDFRSSETDQELSGTTAAVLDATFDETKDEQGQGKNSASLAQLQGKENHISNSMKDALSRLMERRTAVLASPFSRYTLSMYTPFEIHAQSLQDVKDHAGLLIGYSYLGEDENWVDHLADRFRDSLLRTSSDLVHGHVALLYLAPPTRIPNVSIDPGATSAQDLPFLDWITSQDAFKRFLDGMGSRMLYIQGVTGTASRMAMLPQYLYSHYEMGNLDHAEHFKPANAFYFKFDKLDSRYNNIRSMIVTVLKQVTWRSWCGLTDTQTIRHLFESLEYYHFWSLSHLFKLFTEVLRFQHMNGYVLFLCCFDHCVEEERTWFLTNVLEQQSHSELSHRVVIATTGPDNLLKSLINDSQTVSLENCPIPGYAVDDQGVAAGRLGASLTGLLRKRPVLKALQKDLEDLMDACQYAPHLGHTILGWLGHFGRGAPIADIIATVKKLRPVTPENVLRVLLGGLPLEKLKWALLVHQWVKYAMEPLTIEALGHALAASDDMSLLDIDYEQLRDDLQIVFSGIIMIDGRDVKFSHASFYHTAVPGLDDGRDEQPSFVHGLVAEACLKYLMQDEVQPRYAKLSANNYHGGLHKSPLFLPRDDLLEYAVRFWHGHYRFADSYRPLGLALRFFSKSEAKNRWAEADYLLSNPFTRIQQSYLSPLPVMAALGLEDVMSQQLEDERSSEWFQEDAWLSITEAARNGHRSIVVKLLAHVQVEESGLRDAILWATSSDNEGILVELLERVASLENLSWPEYILSRAAAAGLQSLISALSRTGHNLDKANDDTKETAIHTAIFWGQKAMVRFLLDSGVDLGARDRDGRTPLLLAVEAGELEIVQMLLDKGASLDDKDNLEQSVVNTAISSGDHGVLKLVLSAGADFKTGKFDTESDGLRYPIIHAADYARQECLRLLIESGADVHTESKDGSPLYVLCRDARLIESCRHLLELGAEPNQCYPDKEMLINLALRTNSKELIGLLLEKGARLDLVDSYEDTDGKTPLLMAVRSCSLDMVEFLLDNGASANYTPEEANSPLFSSTLRKPDLKKAKLLLERGADVHWKRDDSWTPLHSSYDLPAFVSLFLEHGADINAVCPSGTVAIMAARWNYIDTLKTLVAHQNPPPDLAIRADSPDDNSHGYTALLYAVSEDNYGCAEFLLEAGAQLDDELKDLKLFLRSPIGKKPDGEPEGMHKFIKTCLARRTRADQVDEDGNTALHGINAYTPLSVIQLLLDSGAPVDTVNVDGLTPLALAAGSGHVEGARLLISRGARASIYNPSFGSVLHLACKNRFMEPQKILELMKLLIGAKADPNALGPEPSCASLLNTVLRAYFDLRTRNIVVRYLVRDVHVDVNIQDRSGSCAIIRASCDTGLLRYFIRHGANINLADGQGRRTIHHVIADTWEYDSVKSVPLFAKHDADFQSPDNYGRTPLHLAAGMGFCDLIESVLANLPRSPDGMMKDADGWTPLMWACRRSSNAEAVEQLVKKFGVDFWATSNDGEWSALKLACLSNMDTGIKDLLTPPEDQRERIGKDGRKEVWDPDFHTTPPGKYHPGVECDSCLMEIVGPRYVCVVCKEDINLCFKCFPNRTQMHDVDHGFKEYEETEDTQSDQISSESGGYSSGGDESELERTDAESDEEDDDDSVANRSDDTDIL